MHLQSFVDALQRDLAHELPGREAQYRMAPRPRRGGNLPYDDVPATVRHSGVLILFYPQQAQIYLPLILRPTYDGVHSGQIGLPGGRQEEQDVDLVATALREAYEEIGVVPTSVTVLGQLSPLYVFASNNLVHPTVAWIDQRPAFQPDQREVALLIEAPLADLLDPNNRYTETWQLRDRTAEVPFFRVQGQTIWGATAMILSELLALPAVEGQGDHQSVGE